MCTELAGRGFLTLCAIEHANAAAGCENVALDVKALIDYARRQADITDVSKLRVDPALDPFSRVNGFNPEGPSHYPLEFQEKYAKAQAAMMNTLIERALGIRARLRSGTFTDATADEIVIQQFGFASKFYELDPGAMGSMTSITAPATAS